MQIPSKISSNILDENITGAVIIKSGTITATSSSITVSINDGPPPVVS